MAHKTITQISDRSVEMLEQYYKLQTATDGVNRPELFSIDKSKLYDEFTSDVTDAILLVQQANLLNQQVSKLIELGRKIESEGIIEVEVGDSYSQATIEFVCNFFEKSDYELLKKV